MKHNTPPLPLCAPPNQSPRYASTRDSTKNIYIWFYSSSHKGNEIKIINKFTECRVYLFFTILFYIYFIQCYASCSLFLFFLLQFVFYSWSYKDSFDHISTSMRKDYSQIELIWIYLNVGMYSMITHSVQNTDFIQLYTLNYFLIVLLSLDWAERMWLTTFTLFPRIV